MTLRYAILGLLASEPASGLDLVRRFQKSAGFAWFAYHSQIYPELARCLQEGLIEEIGTGPRGKRVYRTTQRGRAAVQVWLRETEPDRVVRNDASLRSFFTWLLEPDEAEAFYRSEANYHGNMLRELEQLKASLGPDPPANPADASSRLTLELGLRLARVRMDWATWAADQTARQLPVSRQRKLQSVTTERRRGA